MTYQQGEGYEMTDGPAEADLRTREPPTEIEVTPEMIERALSELGFWTSEERPSRLVAERILRAAFGKPNASLDAL